jgi:hypothetical protein
MTKKQKHSTRPSITRISKLHVFIGIAYMAQIIAFDASKLVTPDVVLKRWVAVSLLIAASGICWFLARTKDEPKYANKIVWTLVIADILFASFNVYTQRGMASKAVLFYVLAILTAAVLHRKGAIYLAGLMSVVAYLVTCIAYFVLNFNEGYKVELYTEIGFYSVVLLVISGMSWALVRTNKP